MSEYNPNLNVQQPYTAANIQGWLISNISSVLGVEPDKIDIREPLENYGLDSAQAMIIASKAEKFLGFKLSAIYLWYYPNIEELAQRLAEQVEESQADMFQL
jgi:acyl carrier protein